MRSIDTKTMQDDIFDIGSVEARISSLVLGATNSDHAGQYASNVLKLIEPLRKYYQDNKADDKPDKDRQETWVYDQLRNYVTFGKLDPDIFDKGYLRIVPGEPKQ